MKQITITLWSSHSEEKIKEVLNKHLLNEEFLKEIEGFNCDVKPFNSEK